ncbi:hypothetical protein B0T25DRAFT_576367 [Lasiosphaeria hispida]|uniref:Uncharacterized protein n=1 Tax=Lasiosphaeria hispida TaxID=260671 RepID=A0AAJ0MKK2_9PEZI|nr:hypothetical protein B0T25DRAFT_576367 [Lasiosphaeria hispida]
MDGNDIGAPLETTVRVERARDVQPRPRIEQIFCAVMPCLARLETNVFGKRQEKSVTDGLPATYRYYEAPRKRVVCNPADDIPAFLRRELSLGGLAHMLKHLWFAGAELPATLLQVHVAMGRDITIADQMDLHLLWANNGRLFVKPVPRFLLDPAFDTCRLIPRRVTLGFLYTYACLISSESDFHIANEKRLLPRKEDDTPIKWAD